VDSQIGNCPPDNSFKEDSNPEFFCDKCLPLGNKKEGWGGGPVQMIFWKNKVVTLQGKKRWNLADLEYSFLYVTIM
jgi:hypothetical protein